MKKRPRVLFLTKHDRPYVDKAVAYLKRKLKCQPELFRGEVGDPFPKKVLGTHYDAVISYLSPWIVPKKTLERTRRWNLNFHPGPPDYPGIGCFNFALYHGQKEYGVTAHEMAPAVDTGRVVGVKRFKLLSGESVKSLSSKSYKAMFELFKDTVDFIAKHGTLPESSERWKRRPFLRKELEALCRISPEMGREEVERRLRATHFPGKPGPYLEFQEFKFVYDPER